jgi:hypothetical protein
LLAYPQSADYNQLSWLEVKIAAFSPAISGAYGSIHPRIVSI